MRTEDTVVDTPLKQYGPQGACLVALCLRRGVSGFCIFLQHHSGHFHPSALLSVLSYRDALFLAFLPFPS